MEVLPFNIQQIVYVDDCCLPDLLYGKTKTIVYPDGKAVVEGYQRFSRKRGYREEYALPVDAVQEFYSRIYHCVRNAIGQNFFEDDHGITLTIRYLYGHEETMDGGLYSATDSIRSIVSDMDKTLKEIKRKIEEEQH